MQWVFSLNRCAMQPSSSSNSLIEGDLSEDDLTAAQRALEAGNRDLDRAILSRLTRKGFDVTGEPPLFPDLDALYAAIDEANAAAEEGGDG